MPEVTSTSSLAARVELAAPPPIGEKPMIDVRDLTFAYGNHEVLHEVSLQMPARAVTAFIGPSGCGKTTLLRCFNRMNDLVDGSRITRGSIVIEGRDIQCADQSMSSICAGVSEWFSRNQIRSRNRSTRTSPMACASPA